MAKYRGGSKKVTDQKDNPKRRANKKARGFGLGHIDPSGEGGKAVVDAYCQNKDPLFKVKGKERFVRAKLL